MLGLFSARDGTQGHAKQGPHSLCPEPHPQPFLQTLAPGVSSLAHTLKPVFPGKQEGKGSPNGVTLQAEVWAQG